jgi:hypothetical protein
MKKWTLAFIQAAWVLETIAVILYTMAAMAALPPERIGFWLNALPVIAVLIGAQGTAAGAGPLVADAIKNNVNKGK